MWLAPVVLTTAMKRTGTLGKARQAVWLAPVVLTTAMERTGTQGKARQAAVGSTTLRPSPRQTARRPQWQSLVSVLQPSGASRSAGGSM